MAKVWNQELYFLIYKSSTYSLLNRSSLMCNEIGSITLMNYNLGAKFCRNSFKNGRVHIFIHESIQFIVSLIKFCKEKDLEIRSVKLHPSAYSICIVAIYRFPSWNFQYFLNNSETILNFIYSKSIEMRHMWRHKYKLSQWFYT